MQLDESQAAAVITAAHCPMSIITGGPGTGKTTTLRAVLDHLGPHDVLLASPTGKAARRMTEATGREAMTVHRLLEWLPGLGFTRTAERPLEGDFVVVDEASMLDTELAAALFAAVQHPTRLLLVGDADQLPSVGPGRVFADLIESRCVPVSRLTTLHRAAAESWVCSQAPRILRGEMPDLMGRPDFAFINNEGREAAVTSAILCVAEGLGPEGADPAHTQLLVPQNVGPAGADRINAEVQARVNPPRPGEPAWKLGGARVAARDRVIQTRNDYTLEVMNGETGVVMGIDGSGMTVDFGDRQVRYDAEQARALRLAYALTVHKSQGSEWPWVAVLCHSTHSRMLTRQLLYTAVTRAKEGVVLIGDREGLARAVKNTRDRDRNTGLVGRLRAGPGGEESAERAEVGHG